MTALNNREGEAMDPKTTGVFISKLRKERGLTQKQMADKLNVSDKAVSRWETGKGYPDTVIFPRGVIIQIIPT